jgi:TolB-like protein
MLLNPCYLGGEALNGLFKELRRRSIFRVAGVYAVVGWLLMQIVSVMTPALALPGWVDSFFAILLIIGFPLALLLAWAFEMTPDGVAHTKAVSEGESIAPETDHKLDYVIIGGLALVGVMILTDRLTPEKTSVAVSDHVTANADDVDEVTAASIAVLPFADLSPAGDQEYFSDGIAEEILNVLVRVDGLKVASRTSSFQFRGQETIGIPVIADELHVRHVLEGSVRKSGDAIRITAQLIDSKTDAHLWSETYDRKLTAENVFALQDEIAAAIVNALRDKLGVAVGDTAPTPVKTDNVDAYGLFLQARRLYQARQNFPEIERLLAEAVTIDPNYADAWAMRGASWILANYYEVVLEKDFEESQARSADFIQTALRLQPEHSLALASLGLRELSAQQEFKGTGSYQDMMLHFDRVIVLDPANNDVLNWRGTGYLRAGYLDLAEADFRKCAAREPAYAPCRDNLFSALVAMGRRTEAEVKFNEALEYGAIGADVHNTLAVVSYGDRQAFLFMGNSLASLRGWHDFGGLYDALRGESQNRAQIAARFETFLNQSNNEKNVAWSLLPALGVFDDSPLSDVWWLPVFKEYRQSPQFREHVRKGGIYDYWLDVGFPPQCRPVGDDDFECD